MTIAEELTREALALNYEDLPADVVREAKRRVLDTLGCAVAGFDSPPSSILQDLVIDLGGRPEATIVGRRDKVPSFNAALVNGVMVRYTEAVDRSIEGSDGVTQHGHPCEIIPSLLAIGEREHSAGTAVITAVVLGYELMNRISYASGGANAIERHGWKHEIRAALVVPVVVGKLMGLTESQIVDAVGISGSYPGAALGVVNHELEESTMARNLRFPHAASQAIFATMMAQRGFKGPKRVFEGHAGFAEVVLSNDIDLARLARKSEGFNIRYTSTKAYPVCGPLQSQTEALLRLIKEHDLTAEDIVHVRIMTTPLVVRVLADPATHRYPQTKETADHSAFYVAAVTIVDRAMKLNLDQFAPERLRDPKVREVIDKIELVAVPEWKDDQGPTEIDITTKTGARHHCRVDYPKGHVLNPLTDSELADKFVGMAERLMGKAQTTEIVRLTDQLDQLPDVSALMRALVLDQTPQS